MSEPRWKLRFHFEASAAIGRPAVETFEDEAEARIRLDELVQAWPEGLKAVWLVRPDSTASFCLSRAEVEDYAKRRAAVESQRASALASGGSKPS